ncbi:SLATT domain-containing protein [Flavobacterium marginilacus]|uniref:SLATT domain-containing protein n=1 Tax=Flavobacterium marginilacus TaxID=3003256 RepID=UPI00248ED060|nr:SLATT domain-containing protein [Flavobacterium marginilacus]
MSSFIKFIPLSDWDNQEAKKKVNEIYTQAILLAKSKIKWYEKQRVWKGRVSKWIRFFAILLLMCSSLVPYISLHSNDPENLYIGYFLAALAGGILLFDKYYGFSNSWIRFTLIKMDLENMTNSFIVNWQVLYLNNFPLAPEGFAIMIDAQLKFQESFNNAIRKETETWAKEFQENLAELAASIKSHSEALKADIEEQKERSKVTSANAESRENSFPRLNEEDQFELLKAVIYENGDAWRQNIKGFTGVSIAKKVQGIDQTVINPGTYCLQFNVSVKESDFTNQHIHAIPPFIYSRGYKIPTDVIETGIAKSSIFSGKDLQLPKPPGVSIGRQNINSAGTLGMRVRLSDGKLYGLSCYHVIFPEELLKGTHEIIQDETQKIIDESNIISPASIDGGEVNKKFSFLGKVSHGVFDRKMDCAFFRTTDEDIGSTIYNFPHATMIHDLKKSDEKELTVKFCGRTSGKVEGGKVFSIYCTQTVNYFGTTNFNFTDVIQLEIKCDKGDSGSVVLTEDNKLLAMIFASGNGYAWAIPMRSIFNRFPFTID